MALQFRFRFEIEGVVTSWASRPSPLPSHPGHQLALVADALEGANIACHTVSPRSSALRYRDPDTWNVDSAGMVEGRIIDAATLDSEDSDSDSSSDWRPSPWSSQGPTLPPRRRNGFVLVSPFFYTPDNRWKGMMRHALVTLGSTVRWEVDWTTGLRIHLHNAERWFTDEELMRLALFCCRFEDATDPLHPSHYQNDNDRIMSNRDIDRPEVYARIQAAPGRRQLHHLVRYTWLKYISYEGNGDACYFRVDLIPHSGLPLIEFWQPGGTTDLERLTKWADFICACVNFALTAPLNVITAPGETMEHLKALIRW